MVNRIFIAMLQRKSLASKYYDASFQKPIHDSDKKNQVTIRFCPRVPRLPPSPFSVKFCFVFKELSTVAIYIACKCPAPFFLNFRIRPWAV